MTQASGSFAALGINPAILNAIEKAGYEEPSPIQAQAIPLIMAGRDMIGQAQTGTGKTAAFALPILSLIDPNRHEPQALVLAPTRELALQVAEAFETYASQMPGIKVVAVYGGAPMGQQLRALRNGAQVIVATPGRLVDHLSRNANLLSGIGYLVLDEADEMLKLGFMDDLELIFQSIPEQRQTVLFSATLPHSIRAIAEQHLRQPEHVKIASKTQTVERITQSHIMVHNDQKTNAVLRLLETEEFDALIAFVRTKQQTLDLADSLQSRGYKVAALNGDIAQNHREQVIESLKNGRLDIVVATDVAARGLDVPRITHVLNIDMPYDPESYVHRIGRTGRAGREGRALLLVTPRERRMLQVVERVTKQKIEEIKLPDAEAILQARSKKIIAGLRTRLEQGQKVTGLHQQLLKELDCTDEQLALALLHQLTEGQALDIAGIEREYPVNTVAQRGERNHTQERRRERNTDGPIFNQARVRCRTSLGTRDGIAARNLLGAILNEGGLAKEAIGRIQIRETFSLIELPEAGLEQTLGKLKDTRVGGKALRLRRYHE